MSETMTRFFRNAAVPHEPTHGPIVSGAMAWIKPLGTRLTAPGHNRFPSASILASLAPKGVPTGAARIGAPTGTVRRLGRCPAIAARTISRTEAFPTAKRVARRLLSDVHDGRDWTWNRDRDGAEGGFSLASHRDGSGAPLAHACDGKAAVDDVQDRARLRWGAVDHSADRSREVRAPLGDPAPTGDLRSPRRLGPGGSHRSRRQCHPLLGGARAARHRAAQLPGLRPRMDLAGRRAG